MLRAIARQLGAAGAAAAPGGLDEEAVAPPSPWHSVPLFVEGAGAGLSASELEQLQLDGHVVLPGVLNEETIARTIEALTRIDVLEAEHQPAGVPNRSSRRSGGTRSAAISFSVPST